MWGHGLPGKSETTALRVQGIKRCLWRVRGQRRAERPGAGDTDMLFSEFAVHPSPYLTDRFFALALLTLTLFHDLLEPPCLCLKPQPSPPSSLSSVRSAGPPVPSPPLTCFWPAFPL